MNHAKLFILAGMLVGLAAGVVGAADRPLLITDTTVIDGTGAPLQPHLDVLIENGKIAALRPHAANARAPRGTIRRDGAGKFLLPGLIDVHIHLVGGAFRRNRDLDSRQPYDEQAAIRALQGYLYAGFTTVYDAGNDGPFIFHMRKMQREGRFASPRLLASGFYLTAPNGRGARPTEARIGTPIRPWPEGAADVDAQIAAGPDIQKITYEAQGIGPNPLIPALPKDVMRQAIEMLHGRGIKTTVHVSHEQAARDAIEAGIDSLAHTPTAGVITPDFVTLVAARQIPIATTMSVFDEIVSIGAGADFVTSPMYMALIEPDELSDRAKSRDRYNALGWPNWFAALTPYLKRNVKMLHDGGAVLALGTDKSFAPFAIREMQLLADAGLPPLAIIKAATSNAARFLDRDEEFGAVAVGKSADLVLLTADPTADIMNIQAIEAVIQAGRIVDRAALDVPINRRRKPD